MRYVTIFSLGLKEDEFQRVREIFARHGIEIQMGDRRINVPFEKSDGRLATIQEALRRTIGHDGVTIDSAAFEPRELEEAELVLLRVHCFCGDDFETWREKLRLPTGTRVMDKRAMGKRDIARTYAWKEIVISERLKEILAVEKLTGWTVDPVQHMNPARDRFPPMYQLGSSNLLPPLASETEIEVIEHPGEPKASWKRGPCTTVVAT